jgi:hypothetical protein
MTPLESAIVGLIVPLANTMTGAAFGGGVGLMLIGLYLRWRLNDDCMTTEERAKEGRLTAEQARRRMTILRLSGPIVILLGLALFAFVLKG